MARNQYFCIQIEIMKFICLVNVKLTHIYIYISDKVLVKATFVHLYTDPN